MTLPRMVTMMVLLGFANLAAAAPVTSQRSIRYDCGYQKGQPVTLEQARCIARAIGMVSGVTAWTTTEEFNDTFAERVWMIQNTIQETADGCGTWGMSLEVSKFDAQIVNYGLWQKVCLHDEKKREPLVRPPTD